MQRLRDTFRRRQATLEQGEPPPPSPSSASQTPTASHSHRHQHVAISGYSLPNTGSTATSIHSTSTTSAAATTCGSASASASIMHSATNTTNVTPTNKERTFDFRFVSASSVAQMLRAQLQGKSSHQPPQQQQQHQEHQQPPKQKQWSKQASSFEESDRSKISPHHRRCPSKLDCDMTSTSTNQSVVSFDRLQQQPVPVATAVLPGSVSKVPSNKKSKSDTSKEKRNKKTHNTNSSSTSGLNVSSSMLHSNTAATNRSQSPDTSICTNRAPLQPTHSEPCIRFESEARCYTWSPSTSTLKTTKKSAAMNTNTTGATVPTSTSVTFEFCSIGSSQAIKSSSIDLPTRRSLQSTPSPPPPLSAHPHLQTAHHSSPICGVARSSLGASPTNAARTNLPPPPPPRAPTTQLTRAQRPLLNAVVTQRPSLPLVDLSSSPLSSTSLQMHSPPPALPASCPPTRRDTAHFVQWTELLNSSAPTAHSSQLQSSQINVTATPSNAATKRTTIQEADKLIKNSQFPSSETCSTATVISSGVTIPTTTTPFSATSAQLLATTAATTSTASFTTKTSFSGSTTSISSNVHQTSTNISSATQSHHHPHLHSIRDTTIPVRGISTESAGTDSPSRKSVSGRSGAFLEIPKWRMLIRRTAVAAAQAQAQSSNASALSGASVAGSGSQPPSPNPSEKECIHCALIAELRARPASPPSSSQNSASSIDEYELDTGLWPPESAAVEPPGFDSNVASSSACHSTAVNRCTSPNLFTVARRSIVASRLNGSVSAISLTSSNSASHGSSLDDEPLSECNSLANLSGITSTGNLQRSSDRRFDKEAGHDLTADLKDDANLAQTIEAISIGSISSTNADQSNDRRMWLCPSSGSSVSMWSAVTPAVSPSSNAGPTELTRFGTECTIKGAAARLIDASDLSPPTADKIADAHAHGRTLNDVEDDRCGHCHQAECNCPPTVTPVDSSRNASLSSVGSGILPMVTLSLPPIEPSPYGTEQIVVPHNVGPSCCSEVYDNSNCITVVSLEVPVLSNKSGRSASVDSAYLQVPQRTDIGSRELPPGRGQRSRSVDIALPVGPDGPYIVVPNPNHRTQQLITQ